MARLSPKRFFGSNLCHRQHDSRIRHDRVRPASCGCLAKQAEIIRRHFHVDLNGSFHPPCIEDLQLPSNVTVGTVRTHEEFPADANSSDKAPPTGQSVQASNVYGEAMEQEDR